MVPGGLARDQNTSFDPGEGKSNVSSRLLPESSVTRITGGASSFGRMIKWEPQVSRHHSFSEIEKGSDHQGDQFEWCRNWGPTG